MQKYQMWIDGKWVDASSGKTYAIVNPASEEEIAYIPLGDEQDVNKAIAAAKKLSLFGVRNPKKSEPKP